MYDDDGATVGSYKADIIVNNTVLLEIKAVKELAREHDKQILHDLKATRYPVGLLINFGGPHLTLRRFVSP